MAEDAVEFERTSGTPSGWKAKLKGRDPFPYVIILCLLLGIGYMTTFNLKLWGTPFPIKEVMQQHDLKMEQQHSSYINGVSELTYVMSVCLNEVRKKECERLHISMPESLYRKMNNGSQP